MQAPPSLLVLLAATNSPIDIDSQAADCAFLPLETSRQFFAGVPAPCFAANTAGIFPSARSNLPAPASVGLLQKPAAGVSHPARTKLAPAWMTKARRTPTAPIGPQAAS